MLAQPWMPGRDFSMELLHAIVRGPFTTRPSSQPARPQRTGVSNDTTDHPVAHADSGTGSVPCVRNRELPSERHTVC